MVPLVEPPRKLRDRIMAVVEPEAALLRATSRPPAEIRTPVRSRRSWSDSLSLRWAATAAAALVLGGVVGATALDGSETGAETRTLASQTGRGHAWVELTDGQAHLVVNGLAAPGKGKVYEVWIQSGDSAPRPASADLRRATFLVESGRVAIPARLSPGDRVMVTAEPAGGSKIPTTTPLVITARA
jgi:translation initiation factor IF-1